MSVTITNRVNGEKFEAGNTVTFEGTATDGVVTVKLIADNQFTLGKVAVKDGKWSISYPFNTAGNRQIAAQGFDDTDKLLSGAKINIVVQQPVGNCSARQTLFVVGNKPVWQLPGQKAFFYKTTLEADADGAPNAYHPQDKGIDFLANAGYPGNWWGLVTDSDSEDGDPIIQKAGDPYPGYYISATNLEDSNRKRTDPLRYVDSFKVPFIVLPGTRAMRDLGVKLGDFAAVYNAKTDKVVYAIYADNGPVDKLGEGSIALIKALGYNPIIRGKVQTGTDDAMLCIVFPGSRSSTKPWTSAETQDEINKQASKHFDNWGGFARAKACFK